MELYNPHHQFRSIPQFHHSDQEIGEVTRRKNPVAVTDDMRKVLVPPTAPPVLVPKPRAVAVVALVVQSNVYPVVIAKDQHILLNVAAAIPVGIVTV